AKHENSHARGEQRRLRGKSGKILNIVATSFAAHDCDDSKRTNERERVNSRVEERRRKSVPASCDKSQQCIASVGDSGVCEEPPNIRLCQCDEVANQNRQSGEYGENR